MDHGAHTRPAFRGSLHGPWRRGETVPRTAPNSTNVTGTLGPGSDAQKAQNRYACSNKLLKAPKQTAVPTRRMICVEAQPGISSGLRPANPIGVEFGQGLVVRRQAKKRKERGE